MTEAQLREIFPTQAELPAGWALDGTFVWWAATRGTEGTGLRRVYLNGGGTDDELRFLVFPFGTRWHYQRHLWPDCDTCAGTGRVHRPQMQTSPFLSGLIPEGREFDAADSDGLRRCNALNCQSGRTEPIYGASNSRIRVPGFPADLLEKTGARGMSRPTKEEILGVMVWCDEMVRELSKRRTSETRYP